MGAGSGLGLVTLGVVAGEFAAAALSPAASLRALRVFAAAALVALGACGPARRWRPGLACAGATLVGLALGTLRMRSVTAPVFPPDHIARLALPLRTMVTARAVAAPERRAGRTVVLAEVERVGSRRASGVLRLTLRHARRGWRYGDRFRVRAVLRRPRNFANPGSFDNVGHLARRGVHVTAFVWDDATVTRLAPRRPDLRMWLERWRARVAVAIAAAVPPPEGPVLQALVVGEEGGIDPALRECFARAGVVHVLSISGLHVGLVATASFMAVRWLAGRSERLLLNVDVARLAALASLGPVLLYASLAGWQIATVRSVLMVGFAVAGVLAGRRVDVLRSLAAAALAVALAWPGAPLEIGVQLSFVSVLAIVCGVRRFVGEAPVPGGRWARIGARLRAAAWVSPCALIGTAPLTALHFHQVSLVGVVANPLVVPLFGSLIVGPGIAGAVLEVVAPAVATATFRLAGLLVRLGIRLVAVLGAPPWAALDVPVPTLVELALAYGLAAGALLVPRRAGRVVVAIAVTGLIADGAWWLHHRRAPHELRVTFLDVGQGDAAVVELPGGPVVVVDAGGMSGVDFDTGAAVVGPFLWTRKILRVDAVVMTHAHPDHYGGLPYLLAHHRPGEFWSPDMPGAGVSWERLVAAVAASGARVRRLTAGSPLPRFAGAVAVLNPATGEPPASVNDSSITLALTFGRAIVLLTGDIEASTERRLAAEEMLSPAAVLKVPHHGSRTSSTPAFVRGVAPRVAVVSVGADNRYRLPSPEVEDRYRSAGACVLRTDRCGAVTIRTDGTRVRTATARPDPVCRCAEVVLPPGAP